MPCIGSIAYHIAAVAATYVDIEGYTVVAITYCIDKDIIYPHAVYIDIKGITLHAAIGIVDRQGKLGVTINRVDTQGAVFGIDYCGRAAEYTPGKVIRFLATGYFCSPFKGYITIANDCVIRHRNIHRWKNCYYRAVYTLAAIGVCTGHNIGKDSIRDKGCYVMDTVGSQTVDTLAPLIAYVRTFYQLADQVYRITSTHRGIGIQGLYAYRIYCYLSSIANCTIVFVI